MLAGVKLDRFFEETGWAEEQLAAAVRVRQSMINRLRRAKRQASLELALRIEDATGGRVRAEEVPMAKATRQSLRTIRARERNGGLAAGDAA